MENKTMIVLLVLLVASAVCKTMVSNPDACGCPERTLHLPICASDGKTYKSICEFMCRRKLDRKKKEYRKDKELKLKFYGKCA